MIDDENIEGYDELARFRYSRSQPGQASIIRAQELIKGVSTFAKGAETDLTISLEGVSIDTTCALSEYLTYSRDLLRAKGIETPPLQTDLRRTMTVQSQVVKRAQEFLRGTSRGR